MDILEVGAVVERPKNWTLFDEFFKNDATLPLPYPECHINAIYSQHFIEHIHRFQGIRFFKECYRTLKPGGVLRTAWPAGELIDWLMFEPDSELKQKYIQKYLKIWEVSRPPQYYHDHFLYTKKRSIEELVAIHICEQDGEHKYLWYVQEMIDVLKSIGFVDVKQVTTYESMYEEFRNIESKDFCRKIETSIVEARKPG